jgi:hypothetical protein
MPKIDFFISDKHSVRWTLPAEPPIGSVVDLGDTYRRVRIVEKIAGQPIETSDASYAVEPASPEDGEPINDPLRPGGWLREWPRVCRRRQTRRGAARRCA